MTLQSNQRIIIVGGAARSGTTLTRNIIGTHSQVIAMPTDWTIYSQAAKLQSITAISKPQSAEDMYRALTIIFEQTPLRKYELRGDDLKDLCELHPPSWDSIFLISVLGLQRKHPDKIILLTGLNNYWLLTILQRIISSMSATHSVPIYPINMPIML